MRLNVRVVPNAKKERLVKEEGRVKIYLCAPAIEGKANRALVNFLSEHYNVPRSRVKVVKGEKARDKLIEIS